MRGHPAINREDRAGREAAVVAGKKQNPGGDLVRGAEAADELPCRQRLARRRGIGAALENVVEIGVSIVPGATALQRMPSPT